MAFESIEACSVHRERTQELMEETIDEENSEKSCIRDFNIL